MAPTASADSRHDAFVRHERRGRCPVPGPSHTGAMSPSVRENPPRATRRRLRVPGHAGDRLRPRSISTARNVRILASSNWEVESRRQRRTCSGSSWLNLDNNRASRDDKSPTSHVSTEVMQTSTPRSRQRFRLGVLELGLAQHALVAQRRQPFDLVSGASSTRYGDLLHVLIACAASCAWACLDRVLLASCLPRAIRYTNTPRYGRTDDEDRPQRLAPSREIRLRKMSPKMTINIQIHMKNRKNHSIDQNTWPVPNSAKIMSCFSNLVVELTSGWNRSVRLGLQRHTGLLVGGPIGIRDRRP